MNLGPALYPQYSSHFVEDETPRAPGPNWYYDVEDYIESHQPTWTWTTFRPSFIIGYARNAPYNFGTTVAVYASLRKARGEPLTFFGDTEAGQIQWDVQRRSNGRDDGPSGRPAKGASTSLQLY